MTYKEIEDDPRIAEIDDAIDHYEHSNDPANLNGALKKTKEVLDALKAAPSDPKEKKIKAHIYVHMGAIYARLGEEANGVKMYTEASKLIDDPDHAIHIPINEIVKMSLLHSSTIADIKEKLK